jgi:uncharacterized repeat protein (TIGR01451 family)
VETFSFVVPFPTADGTVLTNSATVSAKNLLGAPETNTTNNTATAATTVHTPVFRLAKTAPPSVNAGEAITYTISYQNTGSGNASGVVLTDTLPAGLAYSAALDQGAGPRPSTVTRNANGTTTLTWQIGMLAAGSASRTIAYTARPSLLLGAGETIANDLALDYTDANGNDYAALKTTARTTLSAIVPTKNAEGHGFWKNHADLWSLEVLARIQATDPRFDGADGTTADGMLSPAEVQAVFTAGGNMPAILRQQLLATYFNLATHRIIPSTRLDSRTTRELAIDTVRAAVSYATGTLALPVDANRERYSNATRVLDEINNNKSEQY